MAFSRSNKRYIPLLVFPTIVAFYGGLLITMWLRYPNGLPSAEATAHFTHFSVVYVLWLLIFFIHNLFDAEIFRRPSRLYVTLASAAFFCFVAGAIYFYLQPALIITPRRFLASHVLISLALVFVWYTILRYWFKHRITQAVFGFGQDTKLIEDLAMQYAFLGYRYQGVISHTSETGSNQAAATNIDRALVVVPERRNLEDETIHVLYELRSSGVIIVAYPEFYEMLTRQVHLTTLTKLWFIEHVHYNSHRLYWLVKRGTDITIALMIGLVWLVTLLFIVIAILGTSRGKLFFTQNRVGQHGKVFKLYKYRTMTTGEATNTWTQAGDQRITKVGKWLRRLRLDELPQFINILKGDMSVVGPRPEQVHIVEQLREQIPYYDERHIVRPGLTGWAQLHVYAGNLEETKRKLQYDLYYVKHRSLLFDAEIILKTIYNILSFSGR